MRLSTPMLRFISKQAVNGNIYYALATLNEYSGENTALRAALIKGYNRGIKPQQNYQEDETLSHLASGARASELSRPLPSPKSINSPLLKKNSLKYLLNCKNYSLRRQLKNRRISSIRKQSKTNVSLSKIKAIDQATE